MSDIVALKDLCEIDITDGTHKTPTYSNEGFIFLSSKNVTSGKIDWKDIMYIPQWLHDELYKRIAPKKDDILLAKNGTTGVAAIVDKDEIFDIYVSLALIRPDKRKILPRYLLHAINSEPSKKFFDSHLKGIGVPNLHLTHIRETPINVPSFAQQQYIIDILDKLESNISLRKQQLSKLDELVKSRFIELFGDNNYPSEPLDNNVVEMFIGPFGSSLKNEVFVDEENGFCMVYEQKHAIQKTMNVPTRYVPKSKYEELKRFTILGGDIIVSCRGTIGEIFIVPDNAPMGIMHPSIMKIRLNTEKYNQKFFVFALEQYMDEHNAEAKGSGVKMAVSATVLGQSDFVVPPMEVQNQFSAFVEQIDKSKFEIQKSLEKLETLKKALMQKYFG